MFKIEFNPHTCAWEIKLQRFYIFWETLDGQSFGDYDSACEYVQSVGLDKVYRNYRDSYAEYVLGGAR